MEITTVTNTPLAARRILTETINGILALVGVPAVVWLASIAMGIGQ